MIVTVDEVKTHLRIQHDEEDDYIESLIKRRPPPRITAGYSLNRSLMRKATSLMCLNLSVWRSSS